MVLHNNSLQNTKRLRATVFSSQLSIIANRPKENIIYNIIDENQIQYSKESQAKKVTWKIKETVASKNQKKRRSDYNEGNNQ
jgi:hypothetical protein